LGSHYSPSTVFIVVWSFWGSLYNHLWNCNSKASYKYKCIDGCSLAILSEKYCTQLFTITHKTEFYISWFYVINESLSCRYCFRFLLYPMLMCNFLFDWWKREAQKFQRFPWHCLSSINTPWYFRSTVFYSWHVTLDEIIQRHCLCLDDI
jgi:hypothetical protein